MFGFKRWPVHTTVSCGAAVLKHISMKLFEMILIKRYLIKSDFHVAFKNSVTQARCNAITNRKQTHTHLHFLFLSKVHANAFHRLQGSWDFTNAKRWNRFYKLLCMIFSCPTTLFFFVFSSQFATKLLFTINRQKAVMFIMICDLF